MLSQLKHIFSRKRKGEPVKGRLWLKRSDMLFLGFFVVLLTASIVLSKIPHASYAVPSSAASGSAASFNQVTPVIASPVPGSTVVTPSGSMKGQGDAAAKPWPPDPTPIPTPTPVDCNKTPANTSCLPIDCASHHVTGCVNIDQNGWLVGSQHGLLGTTDPNITYGNTFIGDAWWGMLAIADLFLVLFIIITGIRIAMSGIGFRYAEALEALPRIVLAFAAAHLSLLFIACLIGINNGLDQTILLLAQQHNLGIQQVISWGSAIVQIITLVAGIVALVAGHNITFLPDWLQTTLNTAGIIALIPDLLMAIVGLIVGALYLFLAIQLIIRIALLGLLIIIAPLCFACWALPQGAGQQVMRLWLNATVATILVQFLQLTCYTFGFIVLNPVIGATINLGLLGLSGVSVLQMAILWITLRIPGFLQNAVANTMGDGSRGTGATISQALGAATSVVSSTIIAFK